MRAWRFRAWQLWTALSVIACTSLGYALFSGSVSKRIFLPGKTTSGHYQIELACGACHADSFSDQTAIQRSCEKCHSNELRAARDSHPKDKFTDPRNADRVAALDARWCATCHVEHRPEVAGSMGVTLPEDYCYRCHQGIADDRPSHTGMPFASCDDAGCHNFHDNRALYEDFLSKHLDDPDHRQLALLAVAPQPDGVEKTGLGPETADGMVPLPETELLAWTESAHAKAQVNCSGCHGGGQKQWSNEVTHEVCESCHSDQVRGWLAGRHGMRRALALSPMQVEDARQPMRSDANHKQLSCNSCHPAHAYDTAHAAVDACLGCHADQHSLAYRQSAHWVSWQAEQAGSEVGSGVGCSTCHMPRTAEPEESRSFTQHNQNDNLRPNEKMIRNVCLNCHGLGFALNALADVRLIESNFGGPPEAHVRSLELVRLRASGGERRAAE